MKSIKLGWIILGDSALGNAIMIVVGGLTSGGLNAGVTNTIKKFGVCMC